MDPGDSSEGENEFAEAQTHQRQLPDDLPTSLNDRRPAPHMVQETEMYDAWQGWYICNVQRNSQSNTHLVFSGQSQFLTSPVAAKPLAFDLGLDKSSYEEDILTQKLDDSDSRLVEMLAARAAHKEDGSAAEDEDAIALNDKLADGEKRDLLQKALNMAASNGDVERINRLVTGKAKEYISVNAEDEEGTAPLIYASCFVSFLHYDAGLDTNQKRRATKTW